MASKGSTGSGAASRVGALQKHLQKPQRKLAAGGVGKDGFREFKVRGT